MQAVNALNIGFKGSEELSIQFASTEIEKLQLALTTLSTPRALSLLVAIAEQTVICLRRGGRVFFCGNGGSAADAQHLAAELIGKQNYDRPPASGIALTVDASVLTALANDYGYETVFSRQIATLGRCGDVLFGLSTSGRSKNVVAALRAATELGLTTVSFTGRESRDMAGSDFVLAVPAEETPKIQELHITCGHIIFALVERALFPALPLAR
jgi:D-sedoheptulose 7-phosphate isomerase